MSSVVTIASAPRRAMDWTRAGSSIRAPARVADSASARVRAVGATNPCASTSSPPTTAGFASGSSPRATCASTRCAVTPSRGNHRRGDREVLLLLIVQCEIDRAGPPVRNGCAAFGRHAPDELVVKIETADGRAEQRRAVAHLDVRREHAGRRLRRTHRDRTIVDDPHGGTATRELARDGATDDPGADDKNVYRHSEIGDLVIW